MPRDRRRVGVRPRATGDWGAVRGRLEAILGEGHHISVKMLTKAALWECFIVGAVLQTGQVGSAECA